MPSRTSTEGVGKLSPYNVLSSARPIEVSEFRSFVCSVASESPVSSVNAEQGTHSTVSSTECASGTSLSSCVDDDEFMIMPRLGNEEQDEQRGISESNVLQQELEDEDDDSGAHVMMPSVQLARRRRAWDGLGEFPQPRAAAAKIAV